ncbi:Alpha/gamma-adaptin-binding protein p34 [Niveomyces insectorum RCEF 264]|uniref:Alpha/gamma-adaptin-binding protein p34 n=1 Tax=Niveomyces insectorum RCEF 264 TaxID=1081102 RepID=A0A167RVL6_9HYPO|nr:Alpha/gamma-adaptin-binding protein p34 [Niveomyces insectorum RCEF 264]
MEVSNPRRILAVALPEAQDHLCRVMKDLTGVYPPPSPATGALAGTTHELPLSTPYYTARVPVWLDIVGAPVAGEGEADEKVVDKKEAGEDMAAEAKDGPEEGRAPTSALPKDPSPAASAADDPPPANPQEWADAFLGDEAAEVRAALGGLVVVVALDGGSSSSSSSTGNGPPPPDSLHARQHDLIAQAGRLLQKGLQRPYKIDDDGQGARELVGRDDDDDDDIFRDWDGVGLVVGVVGAAAADTGTTPPADVLAAWERACDNAALEFVLVAPGQAPTDEMGEKIGMPRVLEALTFNDWSPDGAVMDLMAMSRAGAFSGDRLDDGDEGEDDLFDPESLNFGFDRGDFAGLQEAILRQSHALSSVDEEAGADSGEGAGGAAGRTGDGEDAGVEAMDRMMRKLLAVRDLGAGLPPEQRRRLAARAVSEVMREL